jgi:hypothetical protein
VADDQGQLRVAQLAVEDVQIGAANAAGANSDQQLIRARRRVGDLGLFERFRVRRLCSFARTN